MYLHRLGSQPQIVSRPPDHGDEAAVSNPLTETVGWQRVLARTGVSGGRREGRGVLLEARSPGKSVAFVLLTEKQQLAALPTHHFPLFTPITHITPNVCRDLFFCLLNPPTVYHHILGPSLLTKRRPLSPPSWGPWL
jgi:hypothetical protein